MCRREFRTHGLHLCYHALPVGGGRGRGDGCVNVCLVDVLGENSREGREVFFFFFCSRCIGGLRLGSPDFEFPDCVVEDVSFLAECV